MNNISFLDLTKEDNLDFEHFKTLDGEEYGSYIVFIKGYALTTIGIHNSDETELIYDLKRIMKKLKQAEFKARVLEADIGFIILAIDYD